MFKLTAVVSLMLIGSTLWAAGLSCDSCGSECASACGTRHFRSCCFNYLRRKRGPELGFKYWPQPVRDVDAKEALGRIPSQTSRVPLVVVENVPNYPDPWLASLLTAPEPKPNQPLPIDDLENRVQVLYD